MSRRGDRMSGAAWIGLLVALLAFVWLRAHDLLSLPVFIDETIYLRWAADVRDLNLLTSARDGKLFGVWLTALVGVDGLTLASLWLLRVVSILISLIGAAAAYSLCRMITRSRWAALVGFIVYSLLPFTLLYDRIVTFDSWAAAAYALALLFAVRLTRTGCTRDGVLCGLSLAVGIGFKASGVFLIALPMIAAGLYAVTQPTRLRRAVSSGAAAYATLGALWLPLYVLLRWRGWDYFGLATSSMGTSAVSGVGQRLLINLEQVWRTDLVYVPPLIGIAAAVSIGLIGISLTHPRLRSSGWDGLLALAAIVIPLIGIMIFATTLRGRYVLFHIPALIAVIAVGLAILQRSSSRWAVVSGAVLVLGSAAVGLPFALALHSDPSAAPLTSTDRDEYVRADSAGYGLPETARRLAWWAADTQQQVHVIGLLSNCAGLLLYTAEDPAVSVECPLITHTGSEQAALTALIDQRAAALAGQPFTALIVAAENLPFATLGSLAAALEPIGTIDRPGGLTQITLSWVRAVR